MRLCACKYARASPARHALHDTRARMHAHKICVCRWKVQTSLSLADTHTCARVHKCAGWHTHAGLLPRRMQASNLAARRTCACAHTHTCGCSYQAHMSFGLGCHTWPSLLSRLASILEVSCEHTQGHWGLRNSINLSAFRSFVKGGWRTACANQW